MLQKQPKKLPEEKRKSAINATAKYSGMAFQLFGACLVGVLLGRWLDARMHLERPLWAVSLTVLFMLAALYALYRQLLRD
ncbi:MAG: AtpZ/AtpI family protein [Saprospiraceae bacterium]